MQDPYLDALIIATSLDTMINNKQHLLTMETGSTQIPDRQRIQETDKTIAELIEKLSDNVNLIKTYNKPNQEYFDLILASLSNFIKKFQDIYVLVVEKQNSHITDVNSLLRAEREINQLHQQMLEEDQE